MAGWGCPRWAGEREGLGCDGMYTGYAPPDGINMGPTPPGLAWGMNGPEGYIWGWEGQ